MNKPLQKRSLATRAKLLDAARDTVKDKGYAGLRVEDVVAKAQVAKGTFFTHFADKDALMDILLGAALDDLLTELETLAPPQSAAQMVERLHPLMSFMTQDRYVFDVILRYSGAGAIDTIGPIALTFERQLHLFTRWIETGPFRKDVSPQLLAEGIQAFATQAMALNFCAIHSTAPLADRLTEYLNAWLTHTEQHAR